MTKKELQGKITILVEKVNNGAADPQELKVYNDMQRGNKFLNMGTYGGLIFMIILNFTKNSISQSEHAVLILSILTLAITGLVGCCIWGIIINARVKKELQTLKL